MSYSLILENISKSYNSLQALSDFNLTCKEGEIIVLLGENGAGKSTLISILSGSITPNTGEIFIHNKKVILGSPQKSFQEKIGAVFQHSSLIQEFTLIENMLLSKSCYEKYDVKNALKQYEKLSNFLEIEINPHSLIKNLSLGEQQLIELMRALWHNQNILLLDELTAHLTKQEVKKLENIMKILVKKGCTVLFITHKLEEAINFADKIIVLQKGKKTLEIEKEEIESLSKEEIENKLYKAMFSQDNFKDNFKDNFRDNLYINTKGKDISFSTPVFFKVENISTIQEKGEITYLKNISFELHEGEILGIAGFEGQGQKILAELLAGQRKVHEAFIFLNGKDISRLNIQERQELGIFYVSDDRLNEGIAQEENISINLQLKNMKDKNFFKNTYILWKNIKEYAKQVMKELFISSKHEKSSINMLSGGNIQKIIIKSAISQKHTKLVLLHQPTYGIDIKTKQELHKQILQESKKGLSFILISSDIDELLLLSNSISVMKQGRLTEFFPNNEYAYEKITQSFTD